MTAGPCNLPRTARALESSLDSGGVDALIVVSSLCAEGTPILALDLCKAWLRRGLKVHVTTLANENEEMLPEFTRLGINVTTLNVDVRTRRRYADLFWKTNRLCRQLNPKAVFLFPFGWHTFMAFGARLAGVANIVAHAGNYPPVTTTSTLRKMRLMVRLGSLVGCRVACCSDYVRMGLRRHFGVTRNVHTIHNGVRLSAFQRLESRRPLQSQPIVCGMVARFEVHKDQPSLIKAAKILRSQGIVIEIQLVGDGSRRQEYERLIDDLDLGGSVRLLGVRRDIASLLAEWHLFVFSVTEDEGLGIALIEAMAAGVPSIASNVGACREAATTPEGHPLVEFIPPGDPEALALSIKNILANPEVFARRAEEARAYVAHTYSAESMAMAYGSLAGFSK